MRGAEARLWERLLDAYAALFAVEPEPYVRWNIVINTVRSSGADGLPMLARFAEIDPYFAPDVADFARILAEGHNDFEEVWLEKQHADELAQRVRPWEVTESHEEGSW